jgi:hypothetical protein
MSNVRWLLAALLLVACASRAPRPARMPDEGWTTSSPGGLVHVQVRMMDFGPESGTPGRRLYYRAEHAGTDGRAEVLTWSPLGLTRKDQEFGADLLYVKETTRPLLERYTLPHGKRMQHESRGVERVISFRAPTGAPIDVELRVFDDGFGLRYRFPETDPRAFGVTAEATGFRLPPGTRAFMAPHDQNNGRVPYQSPYLQNIAVGTISPVKSGWSFPALFTTPEGRHLLLTESGLDGHYPGTHLADKTEGGVYRIAFPLQVEAVGVGDVTATSSLPWATPWRVVIVGERYGTIVESSLVTDLAAPSAIADPSWIRPGRVSWSWWSDLQSPRSYGRLAAFVDLASAFRWEYALIDEGWPAMDGGGWKALARYAAGKNVGLLLWYESGVRRDAGAHGPMYETASRREEMAKLVAAGVRGVKVDFFESDKQHVIQLYLDVLRDAAANRLLVDFHGSTLPRGWERTWPNLMTMESVRGAEMYLFDATFAEYSPSHNTMLVFTRNVVGAMDYTPVTFTPAKNPHRTTWGHELALSVVFESGLQHFADSAQSYLALPEEARGFLRGVPAAWDEIKFLQGEPGRLAVLARRQGRVWYVGGINGEGQSKRVTVPMDFLGNGDFDMLLIADGKRDTSFLITRRQRNGMDTQAIELRPFGGFAMRLAPLQ